MSKQQRRSWGVTVITLVVVTALYAFLPLRNINPDRGVLVVLVFLGGVVGAAVLVVREVRRYRVGQGRGPAQLRGLATAMWVAVLFFSAVYYLMARGHPGEMKGLVTRLDAVYFTLSTVSTVGFGDITAAGQAARAVVCVNLGFDLVVLTLAVTAIREGAHNRNLLTRD